MATLREIRRRIGGVKSTQKITRAMKMIAAVKMRRAQEAVVQARPYARELKKLLAQLAAVVDVKANPLFAVRPVEKVCIVVVTADRGMCGAFNSNIIRKTEQHVRSKYAAQHAAGNVHLICVGRKGYDYFKKNNYPIGNYHIGLFSGLVFEKAIGIATEGSEGFLGGTFDCVDVIYNEFKSVVQQHVVIERVLPLRPSDIEGSGVASSKQVDYIYEPSGEAIIAALVPKHLNFLFWHVLLESFASEMGARMTAMENATTNATDLIRELQLSYNKARQASITKELLEIVSGAEALKQAG